MSWFNRVRSARPAESRFRSYGMRLRPVQVLLAAALVASMAAGLFGVASSASARPLTIVALGDSLTAGFGLAADEAFPAKLERALRARGHDITVKNAGVSGDTASGGLARLEWSVPEGTDAVIVELGANDALRGLDPQVTRKALEEIVTRLRARGIAVLLAGMRAPRNLGADYAREFDAIYPDLASRHALVYDPFFLDGVAAQASLNLADGLHPTAAGVDVIVSRILPKVEELIRRAAAAQR